MQNVSERATSIQDFEGLLSIYDKVNINLYKETEEFLYYIDASQNYKLYRILKHNGKKDILVNCRVENILVNDTHVFYTLNRNGKFTLIRCNLDGKDTYLICKNLSSPTAYCICEGVLYFCEKYNSKNYIKSLVLPNGIPSTIYEPSGNIIELYCFNNSMYYKRNDYPYAGEQVLKKFSVSEKKGEDIIEVYYKDMYFYNNYIVYKDANSDLIIIKDLFTDEKIFETKQCNNLLGVFNNFVLFTYEGFTDVEAKYIKNMLYMIPINKPNIIKLTDCNVSKVQMIGNYIYYKTKEKNPLIYRQNIDGEEKEIIHNSSLTVNSLNLFNKLYLFVKQQNIN